MNLFTKNCYVRTTAQVEHDRLIIPSVIREVYKKCNNIQEAKERKVRLWNGYRVIVGLVSETYFRSRVAGVPCATSSSGTSLLSAFARRTVDHRSPIPSNCR